MKSARVVFERKLHINFIRQVICLSALLSFLFIFVGCGQRNGNDASSDISGIVSSGIGSDISIPPKSSMVASDANSSSTGIGSSRQPVNTYGKEILAPITFLFLDNRGMPLVNARIQIEDFPYAGVTTYEGKVIFTYSADSADTEATPLYEGDYMIRIEQDTLSDEPQIDMVPFTLSQRSPDSGVTIHIDSERTHDLLLSSTIRIEFRSTYTSGPPAKNLQVILQCQGDCLGEGEQERYHHGFTDEMGKVVFVGVDPSHKYKLSFLWYGGNPITLSYETASDVTRDVVMTLASDGWYVGEVPMSDLKISKEEFDDIIKVQISIRQK